MIYCVEDEKNIRELLVYTRRLQDFPQGDLQTAGTEICPEKRASCADSSGYYASRERERIFPPFKAESRSGNTKYPCDHGDGQGG